MFRLRNPHGSRNKPQLMVFRTLHLAASERETLVADDWKAQMYCSTVKPCVHFVRLCTILFCAKYGREDKHENDADVGEAAATTSLWQRRSLGF
jgi:hypothetical protein